MTSPELVFDAVAATGILFATENGATEGCRVLLWGATFGSHCDASGVHPPGVSCSLCDLRSWTTPSSHQWSGECRCSEPWFQRRCWWPYCRAVMRDSVFLSISRPWNQRLSIESRLKDLWLQTLQLTPHASPALCVCVRCLCVCGSQRSTFGVVPQVLWICVVIWLAS